MSIIDIIAKKRDKKELSKDDIEYFVKEYTVGNITDYQASALIMAMYINNMTDEETKNLTLAMAYSGEVLDLSSLGNVVDKHSTGGVGDKITLILMPIIASLGIPVAKMSGRGLGITGGTIDKLESIPGYNTKITINEFINNVQNIGISLIGQTLELAPADKKIYALRDVIGCVESIPLIASSIMSKKIASGANKIVLDVTCGSGAFMKVKDEAINLAKVMSNIGKLANKETVCVITNMEEPVGYAVGNSLEIIETIECLKGNMPEDIEEIVLTLGSYMLKLAGKGDNLEDNKSLIINNVKNLKAYDKLIELVKTQGGDVSYIQNPEKFEKAKYILPVTAPKQGHIKSINAQIVGELSIYLGAGRIKKDDIIDELVGIVFKSKTSDFVENGDTLAYVHSNDEQKGKEVVKKLQEIIEIVDYMVEKPNHIISIIQ